MGIMDMAVVENANAPERKNVIVNMDAWKQVSKKKIIQMFHNSTVQRARGKKTQQIT